MQIHRLTRVVFVRLLLAGIILSSSLQMTYAQTDASEAASQIITYAASGEDFLNPERGFYKDIDLLNQTNFPSIRAQGFSIGYSYIRLANYRDQDLLVLHANFKSKHYLQNIQQSFFLFPEL